MSNTTTKKNKKEPKPEKVKLLPLRERINIKQLIGHTILYIITFAVLGFIAYIMFRVASSL